MTPKRVAGRIAISSVWVLVIITPVVAAAIWFAIDYSNAQHAEALRDSIDAQHASLSQGCARGNILRGEVNRVGLVVQQALREEQKARLAKARIETDQRNRVIDIAAAEQYANQERSIHILPPINCAKAYPKP